MAGEMEVVYISGHYRASTTNGVQDNIEQAPQEAIKWWMDGYATICPHCNTAYMDGVVPDSVWLDGDIEILLRCDIVVMLPGWEDSLGAVEEHNIALSNDKEVVYA